MNRLSLKNILPGLVFGMAGVYITLAMTAADCLLAHVTLSDAHHKHSGTETHSSLCAWACQAASDADLAMDSPESSGWPVTLRALFLPNRFSYSSLSSLVHSRAPPSGFHNLLG